MTGISMQVTFIQEGVTDTDRVCSGSCNFDFRIRIHKELLGEEFDITTSQFTSKIIFPNENETEDRVMLSTIFPSEEMPLTIRQLKISAQHNHLKNCGCVEHIFNKWFDSFAKILNIKNKSSCVHDIEAEYPFKVNMNSFPLIQFGGTTPLAELKKADVQYAILHIDREIRLQYSLMLNAYSFFGKNDYRSCILSCATIIEICLSNLVKERLCIKNVKLCNNSEEINKIIKKCNGLQRLYTYLLVTLGGNFVIPENELKSNIGTIRNNTIHSGYNPTKEESKTALELCEIVLKQYYADDYFIPETV